MILNRFKKAKLLRDSAEWIAHKDPHLNAQAERVLYGLGLIEPGYPGLLERPYTGDLKLARTERIILCLLGAHFVLGESSECTSQEKT